MASDPYVSSALLDDLEFLENVSAGAHKKLCVILSNKVRFLRTFHLCARICVNNDEDDDESLETLLVRIEDAVYKIAQDIHPFCLSWDGELPQRLFSLVADAQGYFDSFKEEINQWYIKFSDCSRQSSYCSRDSLVEFIDSLLGRRDYLPDTQIYSENPTLFDLLETLEEKLKFLKNFICFIILRGGIDDRHLGLNLLSHIKAVAVSAAAHHYYTCQAYPIYDDYEIQKLQLKISELLKRIKPVDPDVYHIYIQALNASKIPRQPGNGTLDRYVDILLQDFIRSLLYYLFEILKASTIPLFSTKDQLHILYEEMRSLRTLLKKQPENFDEKMRDLTGVVVCNAGLVIFSLFQEVIEDGFAQEINCVLFDLLERIKLIKTEVAEISPEGQSSLFNFPKVDELDFIDFHLENLMELTSCECEEASSTAIPKHQIQTICEELVFLQSFVGKIVQQRDEKEEFRALWNRVLKLAYSVEFLIDSSVIGDIPDDCFSPMSFDSITQEINIIKLDALKISDKEGLDVTNKFNDFLPPERSMPIIQEEIVGLDDQATSIMDRLKKGANKLQIVAIAGMPGQGKTTLAKLVYNDASIICHFHLRAWCCISQVYKKKYILLEILTCILRKLPEEYFDKSEEDLDLLLYQKLKRNRYLIVLDDVWNIDAWNSLKESFPNDRNGSRIIVTSQYIDVVPKDNLDQEPYSLRPLTDYESQKLLKAKLFPATDWPPTLCEIRTQIVERCEGHPLAISILAGILATRKDDEWKDVVEDCLSSSSSTILEQCNNMLELTYRYLPDKLKPCLLYFGAFPNNRILTADELTWIWIAEGFVHKRQSEILEDEAKNYLMNLISRNLVMVDKVSSTGEIKTCHIHYLLHMFCMEKAKRERFFQFLQGYDESFDFNEPQINVHRLCIHSKTEHLKMSRISCPRLRSLILFCGDEWYQRSAPDPLLFISFSKLLRVLDLSQIYLSFTFPREIELLFRLRYLAICGKFDAIPSPIANLSNLETLIVVASADIELPLDIWKLKKLRHLKIKTGSFRFSDDGLWNSTVLFNLETFSTASIFWIDRNTLLNNFPSIRKLKFKLYDYFSCARREANKVLALDHLSRLESLKVSTTMNLVEDYIDICFPLNLRKLSLSNISLPWCKISAIGNLPNLEVLKLFSNAFVGETWSMEEAGQFPKLICLRLDSLEIVRWTASELVNDHFPHLVKLVLVSCDNLEAVPSCLGDIPALQAIQLYYCSESAASSIKQIQEEQESMGNEDLKVLIYCCGREEDTDENS